MKKILIQRKKWQLNNSRIYFLKGEVCPLVFQISTIFYRNYDFSGIICDFFNLIITQIVFPFVQRFCMKIFDFKIVTNIKKFSEFNNN